MPKRKSESDDYEKLLKKFKKLEKKVRRRCRSRSRSLNAYCSENEEYDHTVDSERCKITESDVAGLLDGNSAPEPDACAERDLVPTTELTTNFAGKTIGNATAANATTASDADPSASAVLIEDVCSGDASGSSEVILASDILEILGEDPTISNTYGEEIHRDLAVRLEHTATHGLTKELRKELSEKYLLPINCKMVNAPALNAEIKAGISDMTAKRDKSIEIRQKQVATAISCLGRAINKLISNNSADPALVKMLMDAERMLCDCQHSDSTIRRNFILSTMKKDMKDQLQNTKPDNLLFGDNLSETIKTAKAINKSGAELKPAAPKAQANASNKKFPATASTSKNLNWKGPYPARNHPKPNPKTKGPPANRNQQSNSSRHSQQQRTRYRR